MSHVLVIVFFATISVGYILPIFIIAFAIRRDIRLHISINDLNNVISINT